MADVVVHVEAEVVGVGVVVQGVDAAEAVEGVSRRAYRLESKKLPNLEEWRSKIAYDALARGIITDSAHMVDSRRSGDGIWTDIVRRSSSITKTWRRFTNPKFWRWLEAFRQDGEMGGCGNTVAQEKQIISSLFSEFFP